MALGRTPDGEVVEVPGDMFGIVNEIARLWPKLRVMYLNPERANVMDPPYKIFELTEFGPMHVMDVWNLDQRVLHDLHLRNSANVDVLAEIDKANAAKKLADQKAQEESFGEAADFNKSMLEHFGKGKLEFHYTSDDGRKRVVTEHGGRDKTSEVV